MAIYKFQNIGRSKFRPPPYELIQQCLRNIRDLFEVDRISNCEMVGTLTQILLDRKNRLQRLNVHDKLSKKKEI